MTDALTAPATTATEPYPRRWWALGVLSLSLILIGLDNTILNVALPTLSQDLHATDSQLQWIVDGYTLVFAGLLLTAGSLGDRFGRRKALFTGLIVFATGSLAATWAGSAGQLTAARAVMGVGGAIIMPATLSVLTNVFVDARERAKAIGIWAAVSGLGIVLGPTAGGWLLEHFWWGSVFLINVPIAAAALISGYWLVPESRDPAAPRVDVLGAVLSVAGLGTLVWAIIEGADRGWTSAPILSAFAVAAVTLTAFVYWQHRCEHPMLDLRFFRDRRFTTACVAITLVFFGMFGTIFFLTQYLQFVLGYSPLEAGRRATNSSTSRDGRSSHCASSTTHNRPSEPALSASSVSTAADTTNRSAPSPGANASAARSASRWGTGRPSMRSTIGRSNWCRPAKASPLSASTPVARSTRRPSALVAAWSSSADLPAPAGPYSTSDPLSPDRARASNASSSARWACRPRSMPAA